MRKSIKTVLLAVASLLVLALALAIIIPFAFRDQIRERVESGINGMINARVSFSGYKLSLIRTFPNAAFTLRDLQVTGMDEFSGDTLASVESFGLVFNLMCLFGDGDMRSGPSLLNGRWSMPLYLRTGWATGI